MNTLALAWHAIAKWNTRRIARVKLQALDDHLLKDMGVSRSAIEQVVRTGRSACADPNVRV